MSIWDKVIKIPVIRRITTGEKVKTSSGATRGKKLNHFMAKLYDPGVGEYAKDEKFFAAYGKQPIKIPIELLHDTIEQTLTVALVMFTNATAAPYCVSQDGERATRNGNNIKCQHMSCDYYKAGKCKANVRFYFSLQEDFQVLGETMFLSSSIENYINLRSALVRLAEDTKKYSRFNKPYLAGLKLELAGLFRQKKYVGQDGKPHATSVMLVYLEMPAIKGHLEYESKIREFVKAREQGIVEEVKEESNIIHEVQGDEKEFTKDVIEEFYGVDSEGNVGGINEEPDSQGNSPIIKESIPDSLAGDEQIPLPEEVEDESVAELQPDTEPVEQEVKEAAPIEETVMTKEAVSEVIANIKTVKDVTNATKELSKVMELSPRFISSVSNYVSKIGAIEDSRSKAQQIRRIKERLIDVLKNGV